jgi:DNA-binding transcriptional MerR regulator
VSKALFSIGRFARLCRLSVKQLRNYDELGLLPPAQVDAESGYRYYRADQAAAAVSIGLLRSLDVPLAAIREVISGAAPEAALREVANQLQVELARRERTVRLLEQILREGMPSGEVDLVRRPAQTVASVRDVATPETIGQVTSSCAQRLTQALAASGSVPHAPIVGIFPLDLVEHVRIEVAVESRADVPGTARDRLAGGSFARTTHVGPYPHLALAAHRALAWAGERGLEPTGPILEIYLNSPNETEPEQLVTQVLVRLEEPE